jgi:peptide/nickel transport system substrate-binding protein
MAEQRNRSNRDTCDPHDLTRRAFLSGTAAAAATAILAACGSSGGATDTPAPKASLAASPAASGASPAATTAASGSAAAATKPAAASTSAPAATGGAVPAPTTAAAAGNAKKGGVLKVGVQGDPVALDPHSTSLTATNHIVEHIYGRLVTIDATLSPKPDLAESWEIAPDGLVYTFKLRKGVKFHNGQTLVAGDVKYSYERVLDPKTKSTSTAGLSSIDKIEAPDDGTVKITLKKPNAAFLVGLWSPNYAIVRKEDVDKNGDLTKFANGTGPFKFKEYVPNTKLTLERFGDYYEAGKPYLDGIEFVPVPDDTARSTAVRTGTVDFVEYAPAKDIPQLKADKSLVIAGDQNTNIRYLGFNLTQKDKPWANPKVRQAISLAMDRQAIVDAAFYGLAIPTLTVFPPGYWATLDTKVPPQDFKAAKAMLADAGFPNGFKTTIKTWSSYPFLSNAALAVQDQLKQIGIQAEVLQEDNGTFIADNNAKNYELLVSGTSGYTDPNEIMLGNFGTGLASNNSGYSDPDFDKLVTDGVATTKQEDRKKVYAQLQQKLLADNPWVMLYVGSQYEAMKTYVKGYVHNPTGTNVALKDTWLDK